jgi:hypothetical protein
MRLKKRYTEKPRKHLKLRQKISKALRLGWVKLDDWPPEPRREDDDENTGWMKLR